MRCRYSSVGIPPVPQWLATLKLIFFESIIYLFIWKPKWQEEGKTEKQRGGERSIIQRQRHGEGEKEKSSCQITPQMDWAWNQELGTFWVWCLIVRVQALEPSSGTTQVHFKGTRSEAEERTQFKGLWYRVWAFSTILWPPASLWLPHNDNFKLQFPRLLQVLLCVKWDVVPDFWDFIGS